MTYAEQIPLWAEIITAVFVLLGGFIALLGASGVLRLNSFFARVHAPAVITTVGIWCIMLAGITFFSAQNGKFPFNTMLIGLFISITTPVTTIFLMRAALFRSRQRGENVPASINMLKLAVPQKQPVPEGEGKSPQNNAINDGAAANAPQQRSALQGAGMPSATPHPLAETHDSAETPPVASDATNTGKP